MYGMDIASAVACFALNIEKNDQILDLCCAPGAKLCLLFDLLGTEGYGTVTGVDVAKHRLFTAKSIVQKYKLDRVRLFLGDGTKFSVYPPSRVGPNIFRQSESLGLENCQPITPFHSTKLIRNDLQKTPGLYDKVLCDVECTHDGSIAHVQKYIDKNWEGFRKEFLDPDRISGLKDLQRGLLENGFKLLKPGGILVYSTCSFSILQNEDIIVWFMGKYAGRAQVEFIPSSENFPTVPVTERNLEHDYLKHTLRFSPRHSQTSGLFIARIRKII
jgi:16S rRNA C967 or C1407 C5-methylase (RsmB/RsmF family)